MCAIAILRVRECNSCAANRQCACFFRFVLLLLCVNVMLPAFVSSFTCMFDFMLVSFFPVLFFFFYIIRLSTVWFEHTKASFHLLFVNTNWLVSLSLCWLHTTNHPSMHSTHRKRKQNNCQQLNDTLRSQTLFDFLKLLHSSQRNWSRAHIAHCSLYFWRVYYFQIAYTIIDIIK